MNEQERKPLVIKYLINKFGNGCFTIDDFREFSALTKFCHVHMNYWFERRYDKYLARHNPVYWNNKVVCGNLSDYVKEAAKELVYFKQFN